MKTSYSEAEPYITKDGTIIRELIHPNSHASENSSIAEAIVKVGFESFLHHHNTSEEIYHITQGEGRLTLNHEDLSVNVGDSIVIAPKTPHKIKNTGNIELKILCICSPAYTHEDTIL